MLLKYKVEIEEWLNKYHIKNYQLIEDEEYGYVVNVNGHVDLSHKKLKSIDVKFNRLNGFFDCSNNKLVSLEGCPEEVFGSFWCDSNKLKDLNYGPKIVSSYYSAAHNQLKSLKGVVKIVGDLYLANNNLNLNSISELPEKIESNKICLYMNEELRELQELEDFEKLKEIVKIYKEKNNFMKIIDKRSTDIVNCVGKIKKI